MKDIVMLAVGDNPAKEDLKFILKEFDLEIREETHGPQAIRDIVTFCPGLIIVDDALAYLHGYQFSRLLKYGLHIGTPIILLISSQQKPDRFWGTSCGADYCFSKPLKAEDLKGIVHKALGQQKKRRFFFQSPIIGQHTSDLDILKMANDLLDRNLFQEKLLTEISSMNRQVDSVQGLVSVIMSIIGSLFSFRSAAVLLYYDAKAELMVSLMQGVGQGRLDSLYNSLLSYVKREEGLNLSLDDIPLTILGPAQPDKLADYDKVDDEDVSVFFGDSLPSMLCYIAFDGLDLKALPEQEARTFHLILRQAMETWEEKIIFEKSIPFSIIDTINRDAINQSFFLKILAQNMEQSRRFDFPLSLAVLDLENYPKIIESRKKEGFYLRQKIHQSFLNAIRKMDVIAKIGKNRFALVLLKANTEQAKCVYHRVKTVLEEVTVSDEPLQIKGGIWPYSLSYGLDAKEFLSQAVSNFFLPQDILIKDPSKEQEVPIEEEKLSLDERQKEAVVVVEDENGQ